MRPSSPGGGPEAGRTWSWWSQSGGGSERIRGMEERLRELFCPHRNWGFISCSFKKAISGHPRCALELRLLPEMLLRASLPITALPGRRAAPKLTKTSTPSSFLGLFRQKPQLSAHRTGQGKCPVSPELCPSLQPDFLPGAVYLLLVCSFNRAVIFFFLFKSL